MPSPSIRLALIGLVAAGASGLAMFACSGDSQSPSDGGSDVVTSDVGPTNDASGQDAQDDGAADAGADASAVTCSVSPCTLEIAAGSDHICALLSDATVRCWGADYTGQTAQPLVDGGLYDVKPTQVQGLGPVAHIATSWFTTCALQQDGQLFCWGLNQYGGLAEPTDGSYQDFSTTPVKVTLAKPIKQLVGGGYHMCALLSDDTLSCWGLNNFGQCGSGTVVDGGVVPGIATPTTNAGGLSNVAEIGLGSRFSCARDHDGGVQCWGFNANGMLGQGTVDTTPTHLTPAPALVGAPVSHLCKSNGYSQAVVLAAGGARAWGTNNYGQLGIGPDAGIADQPTPVDVSSSTDMIDLSPSYAETCALYKDGTVGCWGSVSQGQGVTGIDPVGADAAFQFVPRPVGGLANVVQLQNGWSHFACALKSTGELLCWGDNSYGQLGRVTSGGYDTQPAPVAW
jgi:alpha-tubulin suppressor-like RCC1 family protein